MVQRISGQAIRLTGLHHLNLITQFHLGDIKSISFYLFHLNLYVALSLLNIHLVFYLYRVVQTQFPQFYYRDFVIAITRCVLLSLSGLRKVSMPHQAFMKV